MPVLSDPALFAKVEAMAREIAGDASPELVELARRFAEAEIDVMRIRRVRNHLPGRAVSSLGVGHVASIEGKPDFRAKRLVSHQPEIVNDLPDFGHEFTLIDAYERRALSR